MLRTITTAVGTAILGACLIISLVLITSSSKALDALYAIGGGSQVAQVSGAGSGQVAYYMFDEASGTTATDSVGSNTGTLIGNPSRVTGRVGGALSFDGVDDNVTLGTSLVGAGDLSVCSWFFVKTASPSRFLTVIDNARFFVGVDTYDQSNFFLNASSDSGTTIYSGSFTPNAWHHLCVTRSGTSITFYIDGTVSGNANQNGGATGASAWPLTIGQYAAGRGTNFFGSLDDVRIYNRAIVATDVTQMYNDVLSDPNSDKLPPTFSNVASSVSPTSATITWTTDEVSDSQIEYGPTTSYGTLSTVNTTMTKNHSVTLSGLPSQTTFNYRVRSKDFAGNQGTDTTNRTFTTGAPAGTVTDAASCSYDHVKTAIANAADEGVVRIPPGTCVWTQKMTIDLTNPPKSLTIKSRDGCTLDATTKRPTSCTTTILEANPLYDWPGDLIDVTVGDGKEFRFTGFTIRTDPNTPGPNKGTTLMVINGDAGSFRIDHNIFNPTRSGRVLWTIGAQPGVIDHNYFDHNGINVHLFGKGTGNESFAQPLAFGQSNAVFIEDNTFTGGAVTDSHRGGRFVIRHNDVTSTGAPFQNHGTESGGGVRSGFSMEVYNNTVDVSGATQYVSLVRGGTALFHNNVINGPSARMVADLVNYRSALNAPPFNTCDGTGPYDINDGVVYDSGSHNGSEMLESAGNMVITTLGKNWVTNPNQWVGYSVRNITKGWGSEIISNTANTLTLRSSIFPNRTLSNNDQYQILRADVCLDMPGYGETDLLTYNGTTYIPVGHPNQKNEPVYLWGNTVNGVSNNKAETSSEIIKKNRDYREDMCRPGYTPYTYPHPTVRAQDNVPAQSFPLNCPAVGNDVTAPVISGVTATSLASNAATIIWTTDDLSTTQVQYGLTTAYGSNSIENSSQITSHSVNLSGLQANTVYHYRVVSRNAANLTTTSADFTFTTPAAASGGLTTGMIAHYTFNEGTGTSGGDTSGNVSTAELKGGATWTPGKFGTGINFDGINDYVEIAPNTLFDFATNKDFSVSLWFKTATDGGENTNSFITLLAKGYVGNEKHMAIEVDDFSSDRVSVRLGDNAGHTVNLLGTSQDVINRQWHHVVLTAKRDTATEVYVDGVKGTTAGATNSIDFTTNLTPLTIGAAMQAGYGSNAAGFFKGVIDDVMLYNRPLTATEVTQIYASGTGAEVPPAPDTTGPAISAVAFAKAPTAATVTWDTNEISDSQIEYSEDTSYSSATILDTNKTLKHSQLISGLKSLTTYNFRVKSRDAAGNLSVLNGGTFTTSAPAGAVVTVTNASGQPSCEFADVERALDLVSDEGVVQVGAGTCSWTGELNITKAITLRGAGYCPTAQETTLGQCGAARTIIRDATTGVLINIEGVANKTTRLTGFEFTDGGVRPDGAGGQVVRLSAGGFDGRRMRVDHNTFNHLKAFAIRQEGVVGVIDHNQFYAKPTNIFLYSFYQNNSLDPVPADNSWATPINWGSEDFLFVENNHFEYDLYKGYYAINDGYAGSRIVFRYNNVVQGWFEQHGTESGGRPRGGRGGEVYGNRFDCIATSTLITNFRSGTWLVHNNTTKDCNPPGLGATRFVITAYRNITHAQPFGAADGTNPWDKNVPGGPFLTGTVSENGYNPYPYVKVAGANWQPNQWAGYTLRQTSGGKPCTSLTHNGTVQPTATITCPGHGLEVYVYDKLNPNKPRNDQFTLRGVDQVGYLHANAVVTRVIDENRFEFLLPYGAGNLVTPATGNIVLMKGQDFSHIQSNTKDTLTLAFPGNVAQFLHATSSTFALWKVDQSLDQACISMGSNVGGAWLPRVPSGWPNQVNEGCYEWNNIDITNGVSTNINFQPQYPAQIRVGEHFFNDTCKTGYTPYTYPHPMTGLPAQSQSLNCPGGVQNSTLMVSKSGTGTGTVSGGTISCGSTCTAQVANGTVVTLTATASQDSTFSGWTGCATVNGNVCTVTVNTSVSVSAIFTSNVVTPPSTTFTTSDRVRVTASNVNTRSAPSISANILGTHTTNDQGAITSNVQNGVYADGFYWWNINFDTGVDGWVAEINLAKVVVSTDTTPPTVSLTAPAAGATVSGTTVTVSANASDTVGVSGVQFKLDGVNLGSEDTTSPYSIIWNTTQTTDGTHSLTAVARDAAGNTTTSSALSVTVNNAPVIVTYSNLIVGKLGTGSGTVSGTGISCGTDCQESTLSGTTIVLTATASGGSTFTGWTGCTSINGSICTVVNTGGPTVTATFTTTAVNTPPDVTSISTNSIDVDLDKIGLQVYPGTVATYSSSAQDDDGDTLAWSWFYKLGTNTEQTVSSGTGTIQNATYTYPATLGLYTWRIYVTDGKDAREHVLYVEVVARPAIYTLSTTVVGSGTITCGGTTCPATAQDGTVITLVANPSAEYTFTSWGGACSGSGSCTLTMNGNKAVSATFTQNPVNDTTAPVISNAVLKRLSNKSVQITWVTNEPATSKVQYGTTASYGSETPTTPLAVTHTATINNLVRNQGYHYRLISTDVKGNATTTQDFTFLAPPKPSAITIIAAESGSVKLFWTNPPDTDYVEVLIFRGTTALSTPTGTPIATIDGTTTTSYTDGTTEPSTKYVYTIFTKDVDGVYSDPQSIEYTTAPAPAVTTVPDTTRRSSGPSGSRNTTTPPPVTSTTTPTLCTTAGTTFTRSLTIGSRGTDVKALQVLLNSKGFKIATTGAGSPGLESTYFGPATAAAVVRFQTTYASEILAPSGIARATGYVGPATIKKLNALSGGGVSVPCTPTTSAPTTPTYTAPATGTTVTTGAFTRDLTIGSRGEDVKRLQVYLNSKGFVIAATGTGSPGNESTYFGEKTKAAVARFQASKGITPASGFFGPRTRALAR